MAPSAEGPLPEVHPPWQGEEGSLGAKLMGTMTLREVIDALEELRREGWLTKDLKGRYRVTPKGREGISRISALIDKLQKWGYKQPLRTKEFQERAEKLVMELDEGERIYG